MSYKPGKAFPILYLKSDYNRISYLSWFIIGLNNDRSRELLSANQIKNPLKILYVDFLHALHGQDIDIILTKLIYLLRSISMLLNTCHVLCSW